MRDLLAVLPLLTIGALAVALVRQRRANVELRRLIALDRLRTLTASETKGSTKVA
jgi:hypothetical protein